MVGVPASMFVPGSGGGGGNVTAGALSQNAVDTTANPAIIVPAQVGLIIRVYKLILTLGAGGSFPNTLTAQDGAGVNFSGPMEFANTGGSILLDNPLGSNGSIWYQTTLGYAFQFVNNGIIQISGTAYWTALPT
jgi:hypothetical protein